MFRDDIRGPIRTPPETDAYLRQIGGVNPFGENIYRLVLAESVVMVVAGEFCDWDESIPVQERFGFVRTSIPLEEPEPILANVPGQGNKVVGYRTTKEVMMPSGRQPDRVVMGTREVPRYTVFNGWLVERWYPASMWGTPEAWSEKTLPDGTALLGPYPTFGDYDGVVGPWPEVPGRHVLRAAVSYVEDKIENQEDSPAARLLKRINRATDEYEKRSTKNQEELTKYIKDKTSFLLSGSLEAGRLRTQAAERAGLRHHVGN
jgi:hypothetical protein